MFSIIFYSSSVKQFSQLPVYYRKLAKCLIRPFMSKANIDSAYL